MDHASVSYRMIGYGSPAIFVQKPIAALFLGAATIGLLWPGLKLLWQRARRQVAQ
jgi:TctA family transporter